MGQKLVWLIIGVCAWPASVTAQSEAPEEAVEVEVAVPVQVADAEADERAEARALYARGAAAFEAGDFQGALDAFQSCYDTSRLSTLLFNIGSSYDRLGQSREAVRHYTAYLAAVPEAGNRDYVESRIILLREEVEEAEAARPDVIDVQAPEVEVLSPDRNDPAEPRAPSRIGPIVLLAAGGATAIGAVVTGVLARSSRSDLEDACAGSICPPEARASHDAMKRQALLTDVLGGVALALVTAGVVWWVIQPDDEDEARVALGCSFTTCNAEVQW